MPFGRWGDVSLFQTFTFSRHDPHYEASKARADNNDIESLESDSAAVDDVADGRKDQSEKRDDASARLECPVEEYSRDDGDQYLVADGGIRDFARAFGSLAAEEEYRSRDEEKCEDSNYYQADEHSVIVLRAEVGDRSVTAREVSAMFAYFAKRIPYDKELLIVPFDIEYFRISQGDGAENMLPSDRNYRAVGCRIAEGEEECVECIKEERIEKRDEEKVPDRFKIQLIRAMDKPYSVPDE